MPTEQINPWEDRAALPRLDLRRLLPLYLAILVSSIQLAFFEVPFLSYMLLPVLFLYVAVAVRTPGVTLLILGTVVLTSVFSFSLTVAALLLSLIVGAGSLAVLFTTHRPVYPAMGILAVVFGLSWFLTGDWQLALAVFAFLPAGILLAYATSDGRGRTSVICWGTAGFLLSLLALACFVLYRIYGELNRDILLLAIEDAQNGIRYAAATMRDEMLSVLRDAEGDQELIAALNEALSNNVIKAYTSALFSILPALGIMLCSILAFEAQLVQGLTYRFIGWGKVLTPAACVFTMSVIAAILYYVSFIVTLFFGSGIVVAVFNNICLILLPGFCVLGAGSLFYRVRTAKGNSRFLLIFLCLGILCLTGTMAPFFLALWGANTSMTAALNRKMLEKLKKQNGPNDHDSQDGQ